MTEINIFAPPPDATLDRIVAANRPRVLARIHRHWWQGLFAKRSFTILSGASIFAAGALVSAAVLVPQLSPGQATFAIHCYDGDSTPIGEKIWGGNNAPPNTATRAVAQANPATQCDNEETVAIAQRLLRPVAESLVASGHLCGHIATQTGQLYGFISGSKTDPNSLIIVAPQMNDMIDVTVPASCPTFNEPLSIPALGPLVACRFSATAAAVYPSNGDTQYAVCREHGRAIWSGEGR